MLALKRQDSGSSPRLALTAVAFNLGYQMAKSKIYKEITKERKAQDKKWGGKKHDASHTPDDWNMFIAKQVGRFYRNKKQARSRFVKIAALAVAAIESIDDQTR